MSAQQAGTLFPFAFVGMWLFVTTLLGLLSGWFRFQTRFPNPKEGALLTLRFKSGVMGLGVNFNGCLILSACPSGLRVAVWRVFGLFQRPFLVPWEQVRTEESSSFFLPMTKLSFGWGEDVGSLRIDAGVWRKLSLAAKTSGSDAPAPLATPRRGAAMRFAVQWAVVTAGATAFFYFISNAAMNGAGIPLIVCFGLPALTFGVPQLIRYFRQRG